VIEQFSDAPPCGLDGPLVGPAEQAFELGDHLLDGVQIGRVRRQEEQPDALSSLRTRLPLWLPRLSTTTILPGSSSGIGNCSTQAVKL